ncbi:TipAS antibiotic-recognition domain-containing protein [Blautia producta]
MMSDKEKFEGFKRDLIKENEEKYGREVREAYGEDAVEASNRRLAGMSQEDWTKQEELSREILDTLKAAMEIGDPAGELAQKACGLHRQWLCMFWGDGAYTREAHRGMGEMYVADQRFKAYYDKVQDGAAEFFCDALNIYCS